MNNTPFTTDEIALLVRANDTHNVVIDSIDNCCIDVQTKSSWNFDESDSIDDVVSYMNEYYQDEISSVAVLAVDNIDILIETVFSIGYNAGKNNL